MNFSVFLPTSVSLGGQLLPLVIFDNVETTFGPTILPDQMEL